MSKLYYDIIARGIEPYSRVLDLGCGDGSLLEHLMTQKSVHGYGVDIDFDNVTTCIQKGISVLQGNLDQGLSEFSDNAYDYVILSQTLQEVQNPELVLQEIVRIGKKGIVTFPNFAYWRIRMQMLVSGSSPKTKILPYEWYNTPNIRVVTINDFRQLCAAHNITILDETPLFKSLFWQKHFPLSLSNLFSQKGVFVLAGS